MKKVSYQPYSTGDIGFIPYKDQWLQNLLWEHLDPSHIFQNSSYTKLDMMKYLETLEASGTSAFFGSKELGVVLRLYYPNKYVVEPHIIGKGLHILPVMRVGIDFAFSPSSDIQKINIYSHLKSVRGISKRLGFKPEGVITNSYFLGTELVNVHVLGLHKEDYELQRSSLNAA
jgi:hypothetical protein